MTIYHKITLLMIYKIVRMDVLPIPNPLTIPRASYEKKTSVAEQLTSQSSCQTVGQ